MLYNIIAHLNRSVSSRTQGLYLCPSHWSQRLVVKKKTRPCQILTIAITMTFQNHEHLCTTIHGHTVRHAIKTNRVCTCWSYCSMQSVLIVRSVWACIWHYCGLEMCLQMVIFYKNNEISKETNYQYNHTILHMLINNIANLYSCSYLHLQLPILPFSFWPFEKNVCYTIHVYSHVLYTLHLTRKKLSLLIRQKKINSAKIYHIDVS